MQPPPKDRIAEALDQIQKQQVGLRTVRAQLRALDRYLDRLEGSNRQTENLLKFLLEHYPTLAVRMTANGDLERAWKYDDENPSV